jgi:hypothetical protein
MSYLVFADVEKCDINAFQLAKEEKFVMQSMIDDEGTQTYRFAFIFFMMILSPVDHASRVLDQ